MFGCFSQKFIQLKTHAEYEIIFLNAREHAINN